MKYPWLFVSCLDFKNTTIDPAWASNKEIGIDDIGGLY